MGKLTDSKTYYSNHRLLWRCGGFFCAGISVLLAVSYTMQFLNAIRDGESIVVIVIAAVGSYMIPAFLGIMAYFWFEAARESIRLEAEGIYYAGIGRDIFIEWSKVVRIKLLSFSVLGKVIELEFHDALIQRRAFWQTSPNRNRLPLWKFIPPKVQRDGQLLASHPLIADLVECAPQIEVEN